MGRRKTADNYKLKDRKEVLEKDVTSLHRAATSHSYHKKDDWNHKHRSIVLNLDHLTSDVARNLTIGSAASGAGTAFSRSGQYRRPTCWRREVNYNPFFLYLCFLVFILVCAAVQFVSLSRTTNSNHRPFPNLFQTNVQKIMTASYQFHNGQQLRSQLNSELSSLSRWCLSNDTKNCNCTNPIIPKSRMDEEGWREAHEYNTNLINNHLNQQQQKRNDDHNVSLDVVFLGDSIMEQWNGRHYGQSNRTSSLNDTNTIFQNYFRKSIVSKAPFEGMALGIAGDTTSNVLWRLQNGEGIVSSPKVWWLLIGTNDIIHHKCRPDVVFLGIQRILQELSQRYPNSIIVVNGVLPASLRPDGRLITPPRPSDSNHHHNNKNQTNDNHNHHHDDGDDENVWTVIQRLNQDLEKFCRFHKYFYVDSSHLFLANIGNANFLRKEKILMKELMNDFIHPTPQGYQIWAKDIVDQLQSLLEPDTFDD